MLRNITFLLLCLSLALLSILAAPSPVGAQTPSLRQAKRADVVRRLSSSGTRVRRQAVSELPIPPPFYVGRNFRLRVPVSNPSGFLQLRYFTGTGAPGGSNPTANQLNSAMASTYIINAAGQFSPVTPDGVSRVATVSTVSTTQSLVTIITLASLATTPSRVALSCSVNSGSFQLICTDASDRGVGVDTSGRLAFVPGVIQPVIVEFI